MALSSTDDLAPSSTIDFAFSAVSATLELAHKRLLSLLQLLRSGEISQTEMAIAVLCGATALAWSVSRRSRNASKTGGDGAAARAEAGGCGASTASSGVCYYPSIHPNHPDCAPVFAFLDSYQTQTSKVIRCVRNTGADGFSRGNSSRCVSASKALFQDLRHHL